jgi:ATP-dependent helicase/nuclease subunit A
MDRISIIRASAGSGKTHYLAGSILRQLFMHKAPDYFKQILAVTFTNKATEQMKRRVIKELHTLASGSRSDYILMLAGLGLSEKEIQQKASLLLKLILHEYSWFSIETIDSFFQRIIKGFTHEMGIPGNYAIELDTDVVLEYAADHLIDEAGEDKELLDWLILFAEDKILEGKSWDFRNDLLELGEELFKESFSNNSNKLVSVISDRGKIQKLREKLYQYKNQFEAGCKELGQRGLDTIIADSLTDADFFQKANGAVKIFRKIAGVELKTSSGELFTTLTVMEKLLDDSENWPSGDTKRKTEVIQLARKTLKPLLEEAVAFIEQGYIRYFSATTLLKNLYSLGILVDLSEKIKQYRFDNNAFILSDAPVLIDRLINHNDTPFIYEKMGNRYAHFFIDEFQDTSKLQWRNFKPLISNALSQGNECLVVGDVKQSIYRWRNGDWEILARDIFTEYPPEVIHTHELTDNWRSDENIVNFNSTFFSDAVLLLKKGLQVQLKNTVCSFDQELELLEEAYRNVKQRTPDKRKGKGNVFLKFFPKRDAEKDKEYYRQPLIDTINELLDLGYLLKDIAILVRDKAKGKLIADFLIDSNCQRSFIRDVKIISEESLLLSASISVNLVIASLRYIAHEDDPLCKAGLISALRMQQEAKQIDQPVIDQVWEAFSVSEDNSVSVIDEFFPEGTEGLKSLPLYELLERIISVLQVSLSDTNLVYLHALLDLVHEFVKSEQGTLDKFLEYWDERGRNKSIPASESQDAIRILTIHKSKGLEYRAVIIPFCNWDFTQKTNSIFWVNVPDTLGIEIPVFPVRFNAGLRDTCFIKEYLTELYRSYVDNLNLLYVALTRAMESLIVFPVYGDPEKRDHIPGTVGDLLFDTVAGSDKEEFSEYFDKESQVFRIGFEKEKIDADYTGQADPETIIRSYRSSSAMDRLFFTTEGFDYFREDYSSLIRKKLRGKMLHDILAEIATIDDVERKISEAVLSSSISVEEGQLLAEHIHICLKNSKVSIWFNGSGTVLNERDIIQSGGIIRRPDRVVVWDNLVHVIDYKSGSEQDESKNIKQVKEYVAILERMGYRKVEGFIWYIDRNEVVEINKGETL